MLKPAEPRRSGVILSRRSRRRSAAKDPPQLQPGPGVGASTFLWIVESEQYGERLVAVRYRYDTEALRRTTTVELVVDERPWTPQQSAPDPDRQVGLQIAYEEESLRRDVRAAGAWWDGRERVWWMPLHIALRLGLEERITRRGPVPAKISNTR